LPTQAGEKETYQAAVHGKERQIMATTSVGTVGAQGQGSMTTSSLASSLDADMFLQLLMTELQSQDPLEPMSNSEICQQLSQIWELQSNMELTDTLQSITLGQNIAAANSMIGRLIVGLTDDAGEIAGYVESVSVVDGQAKLNVGQHAIDLKDISLILDESSIQDESAGA
jgi:flagellar basal-body rod modification protein FlgD